MLSYARGADSPALLEETIGANFERTVAAHGDRQLSTAEDGIDMIREAGGEVNPIPGAN